MSNRIELKDDMLDSVAGGAILYNYNEDGSVTCGINDPTQYKVNNYSEFKRVVKENYGKIHENAIIDLLKQQGIIC